MPHDEENQYYDNPPTEADLIDGFFDEEENWDSDEHYEDEDEDFGYDEFTFEE